MDGNTSPQIATENSQCAECKRTIYSNEKYGAHGLCSQCMEDEHHGG